MMKHNYKGSFNEWKRVGGGGGGGRGGIGGKGMWRVGVVPKVIRNRNGVRNIKEERSRPRTITTTKD